MGVEISTVDLSSIGTVDSTVLDRLCRVKLECPALVSLNLSSRNLFGVRFHSGSAIKDVTLLQVLGVRVTISDYEILPVRLDSFGSLSKDLSSVNGGLGRQAIVCIFINSSLSIVLDFARHAETVFDLDVHGLL